MSQKQSPPKKMTQVQFDEQVRRNSAAIQDGCIAATPKPRAGEHANPMDAVNKLIAMQTADIRAERDLLRERERELVEALKWIDEIASREYEQDPKLRANGARTLKRLSDHARALLAKHGR